MQSTATRSGQAIISSYRHFCLLPAVLVLAMACQRAHGPVPRPSTAQQSSIKPLRQPLGQPLGLTPAGTTYSYTQQLQWLDPFHFVVGRLDGTLTIFRLPGANERGPVLTGVLRTPTNRGVEMLAVRDEQMFVSSNDTMSVTLWHRKGSGRQENEDGKEQAGSPQPVYGSESFSYDVGVGTANSGVFLTHEGREYLLSGHQNGFVLIWSFDSVSRKLQVLRKVDIRSPNPISSPYQLWNVRDIVLWHDGIVITGAEDGDLVMLQVPDGEVLARKRYNWGARRGINGLAIFNDYLVAVACSVGPNDKNTWLFRVQPGKLQPLGSVDLKKDTSLPQSFAFRAAMVRVGGQLFALATTQEGLLWTMLVTQDGQLEIQSSIAVDFPLGDAIDYEPTTANLAVVGARINLFRINLFKVGDPAAAPAPASAPAP